MPSGHPDPGRRERIARATFEVVAERGVEGLTHRAVAEAAGLPLGSTTYHFSSREDLLVAGITEAKDGLDRRLRSWAEEIGPDPDLADVLSTRLVKATGPERNRAIIEYELYVAALRRPALRQLADDWGNSLRESIALYTDTTTATALAMAADGLVLHSLIRRAPLRRSELEPLFRRILSGTS